jgi:hypothetical protein
VKQGIVAVEGTSLTGSRDFHADIATNEAPLSAVFGGRELRLRTLFPLILVLISFLMETDSQIVVGCTSWGMKTKNPMMPAD